MDEKIDEISTEALQARRQKQSTRRSVKNAQERLDFLEELVIALAAHALNPNDGQALSKILSHTAALAGGSV